MFEKSTSSYSAALNDIALMRGEVPETASPPHVIRGANGQKEEKKSFKGQFDQIGLGWLRGSFRQDYFDAVKQWMIEHFGEPEIERGIWRYDLRMIFENGVFLAFNDPSIPGNVCEHFSIEIQGNVLEAMDRENVFQTFRDLYRLGMRASRIDCSFDDYDRIIEPEKVYESADAGDVIGFRKITLIQSGNIGKTKGKTASFGGRGKSGGGRYVRVYDKFIESKGEINAVRWEVETSGNVARALLETLATSENLDEFAARAGEAVGGSIDFRTCEGVKVHRERYERHEWWERILEQIGRAKLVCKRIKPTIQRSALWLKRVLPKTLAKVSEFMELSGNSFDHFIVECVHTGQTKLKHSDYREIAREAFGPADNLI